MKPFEYVNKTYGVNACIGRRVTVYGEPGTIVEDRGHHIGVNFDTDKPGRSSPCHPTSEFVYHDEIVKPRKPSRSAARYQEFLRCDFGQSFAEWMGFGRKARQ
jgi:hypothetical protein